MWSSQTARATRRSTTRQACRLISSAVSMPLPTADMVVLRHRSCHLPVVEIMATGLHNQQSVFRTASHPQLRASASRYVQQQDRVLVPLHRLRTEGGGRGSAGGGGKDRPRQQRWPDAAAGGHYLWQTTGHRVPQHCVTSDRRRMVPMLLVRGCVVSASSALCSSLLRAELGVQTLSLRGQAWVHGRTHLRCRCLADRRAEA
jgi:hypothetical protein